MKKLIKNIREKLELDNPKKYVNGYYQLSKNQKKLWVAGLFVLSVLFWGIREALILNQKKYSPEILIAVNLFSSVAIMVLSYIATFVIVRGDRFAARLGGREPFVVGVTKYITWTIFLLAVMAEIVFKIKMPFVGFLFY
jgi:hypothetical protein